MTSRFGRAATALAVFLLTTGFDQSSKQLALRLPPGKPHPVIDGFWDWQLAWNKGAAFSSLDWGNATQLLLGILAVGALIAIGITAYRLRPDQRAERIALAMIAGGALGNLIDRVRHGAVVDFVSWHVGDHRWPIFNVADVALLAGVVVYLLASVRVNAFKRAKI